MCLGTWILKVKDKVVVRRRATNIELEVQSALTHTCLAHLTYNWELRLSVKRVSKDTKIMLLEDGYRGVDLPTEAWIPD